jgi:hypothetical protein
MGTFSGRTPVLSLFRLYIFLSVRRFVSVKDCTVFHKPSPERGTVLHVLWYLAQDWIYRLKFMFIMSRYTVLREQHVSLPFDERELSATANTSCNKRLLNGSLRRGSVFSYITVTTREFENENVTWRVVSSGMWRSVNWYKFIDVSEERTASIFGVGE